MFSHPQKVLVLTIIYKMSCKNCGCIKVIRGKRGKTGPTGPTGNSFTGPTGTSTQTGPTGPTGFTSVFPVIYLEDVYEISTGSNINFHNIVNITDITQQTGSTASLMTAGGIYAAKNIQSDGQITSEEGFIAYQNVSNTFTGYYSFFNGDTGLNDRRWDIGLVTAEAGSLSGSSLRFTSYDNNGLNPKNVLNIDRYGPTGCTFGVGIVLPTTGGTASILDYYESATLSTDFEWGTETDTFDLQAVRVGRYVTLTIPEMTFAASAQSARVNIVTNIPSRFCPLINATTTTVFNDGSTMEIAIGEIGGTGYIEFEQYSGNPFPSTTDLVLFPCSFTYLSAT